MIVAHLIDSREPTEVAVIALPSPDSYVDTRVSTPMHKLLAAPPTEPLPIRVVRYRLLIADGTSAIYVREDR